MAEKKKAGKAMSYRGKPLARCGNVLYLGNLSASHFVMMQVIQTEKLEDLSVPQKVAVQLITNDPQLPPKDRVGFAHALLKQFDAGISAAVDIYELTGGDKVFLIEFHAAKLLSGGR